jgi:subtilase family serine protease
VERALAAQTGFVPSNCQRRATPDVSMDGGGLSPVYVLISGQGGWYAVYGTSLSVQLWAGVIALANGLHVAPLSGTLGYLYADAAGPAYSTNYRDITSGQAGSFSAGPGWDFVTGLGSPLANSLVNTLIGGSSSPSPDFTITVSPSSQTVTRSTATTYTATVTAMNGFSGTVSLGVTGLPNGTTATFNPTSVPGSGKSTLTVTTSTATPTGTYTLTIKGTSTTSPPLVHSASVTLVVRTRNH